MQVCKETWMCNLELKTIRITSVAIFQGSEPYSIQFFQIIQKFGFFNGHEKNGVLFGLPSATKRIFSFTFSVLIFEIFQSIYCKKGHYTVKKKDYIFHNIKTMAEIIENHLSISIVFSSIF